MAVIAAYGRSRAPEILNPVNAAAFGQKRCNAGSAGIGEFGIGIRAVDSAGQQDQAAQGYNREEMSMCHREVTSYVINVENSENTYSWQFILL